MPDPALSQAAAQAQALAAALSSREANADRLRHFRHLLADAHFRFFLEVVEKDLLRPAQAAALDETRPGKARRRHLARYHLAREILDLVAAQEKTLSASLENARR